MLKLVVCEISGPYGYSKVRNTSLIFLWPRIGPHTVYVSPNYISQYGLSVVSLAILIALEFSGS